MSPEGIAALNRDPDFAGKVAIVTGGGHGIGATIARRLAAAGAAVALIGRNEAALAATHAEITDAGGTCASLRADVSSETDVERAVSEAVAEFGALNVLVNNAGIAGPSTPLADLALSDWESVLAINLTGVFLCCRESIPHLRAAGGGRIVNIGSVTGKRPLVNRTPYASSKLGLVGLTRTLAHELGMDEITVNTISPYLVEGPRLEGVITSMAAKRGIAEEEMRAELVADSAMGHGVKEDDVANLALFLASDAAANMTGQDYNVSAGSVTY
ncbi:MAG TPA: SDR family NAD(P)-dependent oxidoreductase [Solirubrobacterales bacterium]|nr:SDR family NAD(P)-dependent oxidoreductase [Solirubrobacterales bacterium]